MKLPPASRKVSKIFRLSSLEDPQPQSSPNVIVPRQSSETLNPLLPSSLYLICLPPLNEWYEVTFPIFAGCTERPRIMKEYCGSFSLLPLTGFSVLQDPHLREIKPKSLGL